MQLATLYTLTGRTKKALATFEQGLKQMGRTRRYSTIKFRGGAMEVKLRGFIPDFDDVATALARYSAALKIDGHILEDQNVFNEARELWTKKLRDPYSEFYLNRSSGNIFDRMNETSKAEKAFIKVRDSVANSSDAQMKRRAYAYLFNFYVRNGMNSKAKALRIAPN